MATTANPKSHLPLQPHVFQILLSLIQRGMHGYSLIKDIGARTEGEMVLGTSTLYAAIKRMVKSGLLEETQRPADSDSDDGRRRYYRATPFGRQVAREEALRIRRLDEMLAGTSLLRDGASGKTGV
jgi:DNA-binding PadR family transcriptional regulator